VLHHEWANARGAIARFERGTIEIRVIDAQECPRADLAVVAAIVSVVKALAVGRLSERDVATDTSTESLARLLAEATFDGERAVARDRTLLRALGVRKDGVPLGEIWDRLLDAYPPDDPAGEWTAPLQTILRRGPLARRMLDAAGASPSRSALRHVAEGLCRSLERNESFAA
jgi:gamma-glutamyl:cysteine ligase YbdK (ATP-grasp superfamily)